MLIDRTIIQRHGAYAVLAQRHEVMWRDGTHTVLHPVQFPGGDATALRALQLAGGGWLVVDVTRCAPGLADDLRQLPLRDHPGTVFYALRLQYPTAAAFVQRAAEQFTACWHPQPESMAA